MLDGGGKLAVFEIELFVRIFFLSFIRSVHSIMMK